MSRDLPAGGPPEDVLREFLAEALEIAVKLDSDLVALERDPEDRERLAAIFRGVHTIKGNSGFLGFGRLQSLAHAGESLLSRLRDGGQALTRETITALLATVDAIRKMLASIERTGAESPGDDAAAREALESLSAEPAAPAESGAAPAASETRIRVDVGVLDRLMTLVGELVLSRNRIVQLAESGRDGTLAAAAQRLAAVTTELQEGVMKARMQPVRQLWSRFPRVVRDLSLACGKPVNLVMEGDATELDRSVLEAIADPLVHMLRNAVDHGIEKPAERAARGKPAEGRVLLRAFHQGGQVFLEVSDDGAGIDPDRLRRRAVQLGKITPEQAARLGDREALDLVFLPGFSTAAEVTTVSGRGVGMDVVRSNLQAIGGSVEIQTRAGAGTLFRLKIPLTLAIIPALVFAAGRESFAIPQVALVELVRVEAVETAFEMLHRAPVFRLRNQLLPLVFLEEVLELPGGRRGSGAATVIVLQAGESLFGLVVDAVEDTAEIVVKPLGRHLRSLRMYAGATVLGDGRVALILDVPGLAQHAHVTSGETKRERTVAVPAAPDAARGRDALVLLRNRDGGRMALAMSRVARLEEFPRSVVERVGGREVVQYRNEILPLIELATALPERRTGNRPPVDGEQAAAPEHLQVIVASSGGRRLGLVVDRVIDIVEESLEGLRPASRAGVRGCAVIRGRVTEVLDVDAVLQRAEARAEGGPS
jgi:two-component system, chemotaxis family, sensor kinase CheA